MPAKLDTLQEERGGEVFQTDSKMVYGGYFCKKAADGSYMAKMHACDGLIDQQCNMPSQQYKSRHDIRKQLASALRGVSGDCSPRSREEEKLILQTRDQLDELLHLLDEEVDLPALLSEDTVQKRLEEMYEAVVSISRNIEKSNAYKSDDIENRDYKYLHPTARQQLKKEFLVAWSRFQTMAEEMRNDPSYLDKNISDCITLYNSASLQADILHANQEDLPDNIALLEELIPVVCEAVKKRGSDVLHVRTPKGEPRPCPENSSSLDQAEWGKLMEQYDSVVQRMAIIGHTKEGMLAIMGDIDATILVAREYEFFLQNGSRIQEKTGPLSHFADVSPKLEQLIAEITTALSSHENDSTETIEAELDQSAIQQLKMDLQDAYSNFETFTKALSADANNFEVAKKLMSTYNTIVLYASILEQNGYKLPELPKILNGLMSQMYNLTEELGGDMMSVRTLRGAPRPFPPNTSASCDENEWNTLLRQYDEAVHAMSISEHIAERRIPVFGHQNAYMMLIHAYNSFIQSAKTIQQRTGELRHYALLKTVMAPQMHRLAEAIDFPTDELEEMGLMGNFGG